MASLGVVDRHHEQEFLSVMQSYVLWDTGAGADCSQSSGLCVLGLIRAKHGTAITDYLFGQFKDTQNEMTCHWSCLGLGLAATESHMDD
ncbi:26S proteasome non-ATPase regulatory subunit 1 [Bombus terrestris]|uniref:26S proteasome non-ATPase regulatory subunit 1 n=1 Tax=Bombus terrestris TaxID=30195 RepID=A0A9C6W6Q0_BOMTE|nr:26S proteasome non-ATPase regulatory subunit 1 [Bombus terrestris]